jgi:hypothetical protein
VLALRQFAGAKPFAETKGPMRACVFGFVLLCAACGGGTTSPSTFSATSVQVFSGVLGVHGTSVYPFNVAQTATVNITLASLTDSVNANSTLTTAVGLAVGTPNSTGGCTHASENRAATPALTAQFSSSTTTGAHCVDIYDVGNLSGNVNFAVRITIAPSSNTSAAAVTETFASTLAVQGAASGAFTVAKAGTISITLATLGSAAEVGLGLGIPRSDGSGCLLYTSLNTVAGATAQITSSAEAGFYCVTIYDVGNLTRATPFSVTIAH